MSNLARAAVILMASTLTALTAPRITSADSSTRTLSRRWTRRAALGDPDARVRAAAAGALWKIGKPAVLALVRKAMPK